MTNLILRDPNVVLVHMPRTGGSSVRKALGVPVERTFFGHIPEAYADWERVSIMRDPKARFLSALRLFKYGDDAEGDEAPRWPDLTISQALDVLEDPWIGFDRSQRNLSWDLKHHLIPQTHPFHCLRGVTRLLRSERLEEDFAQMCATLGLTGTLPHLHRSREPEGSEDIWTDTDENRFRALFAEDYRVLGYEPDHPTEVTSALPRRASNPVYSLWPAYFSDNSFEISEAEHALPAPDIPLEPFVDTVIPGQPAETWAARDGDLNVHFHNLQPEFGGASRLSHLLACVIVVIRRDAACAPAHRLFWRIMDEQFDALRAELSLRWLISIADTIADFGRDDLERTTALAAATVANTCRLYESELAVFYPKRPWPPNARVSFKKELFDGLRTFRPEQGDMIETMFARTSKMAYLSPVAGKVQMEVMERLRKGPTAFGRFRRILGTAPAPLLDEDVKNRMMRMMRRKL
ncbi:hypothetical protein [Roseobacter sp. A03A-229]